MPKDLAAARPTATGLFCTGKRVAPTGYYNEPGSSSHKLRKKRL
jgi:hypothetical protein